MTLLKVFIALVVLASTSLADVQKNKKELTFPENVKQIKIHSTSMKKDIDTIVVLPESYEKIKDKRYPVIYLLHGFGGNHTTWAFKTKPELPKIASEKNIIQSRKSTQKIQNIHIITTMMTASILIPMKVLKYLMKSKLKMELSICMLTSTQ